MLSRVCRSKAIEMGIRRTVAPSYPTIAIATRNYCWLEEVPKNQETELTEIPFNFYHLRYAPGPAQLLWEKINDPKFTSDDLYTMIKKKIHLRYITPHHFDFVVNALYKDVKYAEIKSLLKFMRNWRFEIPQPHYAALVITCARKGDIQCASSHIYKMKQEHPDYPVTANMYDGHIAFWASKGKLGKAKRYLDIMKRKYGTSPVASNFIEMFLGYAQFPKCNEDEFRGIFDSMKAYEITLPEQHAKHILETLHSANIRSVTFADLTN